MSSRFWTWIRWRRFRPTSGAAAVSLLALGLAGCPYGFAGGGVAPHVKTVAILPFDNLTPEPSLTQEVNDAVRQALENRLGLRLAGEASADAVAQGRIVRYEPDLAIAVRAGLGQAEVTQRQVQLTVDVELLDQRAGKPLWVRKGLVLTGPYRPPQETEGRRVALEKLVIEIVEGAQSQW